jgi:hypothetical protein
MCVSAAVGRDGQVARKVEGLGGVSAYARSAAKNWYQIGTTALDPLGLQEKKTPR